MARAKQETEEEKAAAAAAEQQETTEDKEAVQDVTAAASASGDNVGEEEPTGPKYKLASGRGVYVDSQSGFTLTNDDAAPLPGNVSPETLERIKSGYIVKV